MSRVLLGVISGLVFGAIDIGIMLPMSFPDKKTAITAAFIARFGIGFVIGAARLPWPGWAVGLCFGLLLSIPDALITKAYHWCNRRQIWTLNSNCNSTRHDAPG